jgi:transcriptional regulator with XRE-family HTH domain
MDYAKHACQLSIGYFSQPMGRLTELARARITRWMDTNPQITQAALARAVGHGQTWVSKYRSGAQNADVDELAAMAHVYGHTLSELFDARPDPKEADLIEAYRSIRAERRDLAVQVLQSMVLPLDARRGGSRKQTGGR